MASDNSFYGCEVTGNVAGADTAKAEILEVFEILRPKPSSYPLLRIGEDRDGSYLVPDDLEGIAACFSPGVHNFKNFEDFLVDRYGIKSHMCDFSSNLGKFKTPLKEGMQTFQKKWLDVSGAADSITLEDWVASHAPDGDLLLQMDIEGAEYRNILSTPDSVLSRFRIIVVELHRLSALLNADVLGTVLAPFFKKIGRHFTSVHAHPNNCGGDFAVPGTDIRIPNVLELTFLRSDRISLLEYPPMLPHPLDVGRNVARKPPLFLGDAWLRGDRPSESRLKMLEDEASYSNWIKSPAVVQNSVSDMAFRSLATANSLMAGLAPDHGSLVDVAQECPFTLSSARGKAKRTGTVHSGGNFFFHTGFGVKQFIQVDLGKSCDIGKVAVRNRLDGGYGRANKLFCVLGDTADINEGHMFYMNPSKEFLTGQAALCELAIPSTRARYVTFMSPLDTALHFSGLSVYALA